MARSVKAGATSGPDSGEWTMVIASVGEGLDRVLDKALTRPVPKTAGAQMRFLVKQLKSTKAVVQFLGVSQRTVERDVKG
ncbi:hypothetical protein STANM337S_06529 [Streptomyces tanashiensis]